jgi:hypothetical protein
MLIKIIINKGDKPYIEKTLTKLSIAKKISTKKITLIKNQILKKII